jgi:hypothetical protein
MIRFYLTVFCSELAFYDKLNDRLFNMIILYIFLLFVDMIYKRKIGFLNKFFHGDDLLHNELTTFEDIEFYFLLLLVGLIF